MIPDENNGVNLAEGHLRLILPNRSIATYVSKVDIISPQCQYCRIIPADSLPFLGDSLLSRVIIPFTLRCSVSTLNEREGDLL